MDLNDITARVKRLDQLRRGLAKEVALWKDGIDPLSNVERKAYLKGIQDALAGVYAAGVVMQRVKERLEADRG